MSAVHIVIICISSTSDQRPCMLGATVGVVTQFHLANRAPPQMLGLFLDLKVPSNPGRFFIAGAFGFPAFPLSL